MRAVLVDLGVELQHARVLLQNDRDCKCHWEHWEG